MKQFYTIVFLVIFFYSGDLSSQTPVRDLVSVKLVEEGFKNISVELDNDAITVFYENNMYRSDITGIASVLSIINDYTDNFNTINLVIQKSSVPVVYLRISSENLKEMISSKSNVAFETGYEVSTFLNQNAYVKVKNSSRYFTDIVVSPDIGLQLGNYDNPFRFQVNLHPEINTYFWRGSRLGIKTNLPLIDFEYVDKFNYIRPETVTLEQFFRVTDAVFGRFSVGMFNFQRYGFDFETGVWLFNGKVLMNGSISYTGYMAYLKEGTSGIYNDVYSMNVLEKSTINSFQYFGDFEYRFSNYDLAIKVGYGEYLYHNKAISFEMIRNFEEFLIGFRGYSGSTGNTLEGRLIIPLIPNKYLNQQRFRIRMANHLDYSHPVGSAYYRKFNSGLSIDRTLWELNPQYIKNNLYRKFK